MGAEEEELGAEESEFGARCGGERDRGKANVTCVSCDANRFFSQLGSVQLYLQISVVKKTASYRNSDSEYSIFHHSVTFNSKIRLKLT